MKSWHPIYILSKGRAQNVITAKLLQSENIDFLIAVEPQEFDLYNKQFPNKCINIQKNNEGIAYVRNFIKQHSISNGDSFHWQMDDDIKSFRIRANNKNIKVESNKVIRYIENECSKYLNVGIAAPIYTTFAFSQKNDFSYNRQGCSCVLVNNKVKATWRKGIVEDTDYSMQLLMSGAKTFNKFERWTSIIFNRMLIETVPSFVQKGGCTDIEFSGGGRVKNTKGLLQAWPNVFKSKIKNGVIHVLPSNIWRKFPQRPIKK
jgi:hypothetical protein